MSRFLWLFVLAGGCVEQEPLASCATVAPEDCADTPGCAAISGRPVADDGAGGSCVDYSVESVPLGCMSADLGCGSAITNASDAEGNMYVFPSTCLPEGFAETVVTTPPDCP